MVLMISRLWAVFGWRPRSSIRLAIGLNPELRVMGGVTEISKNLL